jgi:hypothetical protein
MKKEEMEEQINNNGVKDKERSPAEEHLKKGTKNERDKP